MLNPLMLLGLLGLAVPIIIHLIQKQRLKPQMLATMQFLDKEDVANAFAPRPRDLLQLILRLVLLLFFVLLMARLAFPGREVGPRTLTVIFDQSLSMQQKTPGGKSLIEVHKANLLNLIDGLGPHDKMSLLLVGDRVEKETGFTSDKSFLRKTVTAFRPADSGATALLPAIQAATRQLRNRHEVNAAVIVYSDQQAVNFQSALKSDRTFGSELDHGRVKLFLIDEKRAEGENLAVTGGEFHPASVYLGASAKFAARLHNFGTKPRSSKVTFYESAQAGESREINLAPGETAEIDLVQRFESPVDVPCRVESDDDLLPGDNRFTQPMRMKERRQVLLITAATATNAEEGGEEVSYQGADLLAYALNPGEALGQGTVGTYINIRRVTPQVLERVSLPVYSLVVVYGNVEMSEQSVRDLKAFVANGGGVWFIPDEATAPMRFNDVLQNLLGGFMLGQLKQPDTVQTLDLDEARLQSPMLLPLLHGEWGDLREVHFREYFSVTAIGTAKAALNAANGDPLLVVIPLERGRIGVQLFSCNLTSGSLPRSTPFVPMVQYLVGQLGRSDPATESDTMRVGEVARISLPEFRGLGGEVQVSGPEKRSFAMTGPDKDEIIIDNLTLAGSYEITHPAKKSGRKRWLAVNPVETESDLAVLGAADQQKLFGTDNVLRLPYSGLNEKFSRRHEIFGLLMVLVLLAFVVEALAGLWQSRSSARADAADKEAARTAAGGGVEQ